MNRLVLCSHGTRSELGAARVSALVRTVAEALPSLEVREAHVDVHPPFVADVVTPGSIVVPLLLAPGHHVQHDIVHAAATQATVTPTLGPDHLLTSLLVARLRSLARPLGGDDVVVLAASGSAVSSSERATRAAAGQLSLRLGRPVHVGFVAGCAPLLGDLVADLRARHRGRRIVAVSYLLAPGHFHDRVQTCGADDVTEPLLADDGPDARLVQLVVRRSCWRPGLPGLAGEGKGQRAHG